MNTLVRKPLPVLEPETEDFEAGDSSLFHTGQGGHFVNTQSGVNSILSGENYPDIIVNGTRLNYGLRRMIFEGDFMIALDDIMSTQWKGVHKIEILGVFYGIVSHTPGNIRIQSVQKLVDGAQSNISKALKFAQKPVSEILSGTSKSQPTTNTILSSIENIDVTLGAIETEVEKVTQPLLNVLTTSPSLDGALRVYTVIFMWSKELPAKLFSAEIKALKDYVQKNKGIALSPNATANKKTAYTGLFSNHLLLSK